MGDLLAFAATRHLLPPVIPGYPLITVGGAVAMNVHGKNQFHTGNFGDHVTRLTLYHPQRGEVTCGPGENAGVFRLTVGGFGLTGHITSVDIALTSLTGNDIAVERRRVHNLVEAAELMDKLSDASDYIYSWHDLNLRGPKFGSVHGAPLRAGPRLLIEEVRPFGVEHLAGVSI